MPEDTEEISWTPDPTCPTYIGRRVECRDESDMFSIDTFPCLQVSSMNRYRQVHVKPKLSRFAVKVYGTVEGMMQLTRDKRAIHLAVRVSENEVHQGMQQLNEMEEMVFEQIAERSRGTAVRKCYLSPKDLQKSTNLEENVSVYTEKYVNEADEHHRRIVNPRTLVPEELDSVNPMPGLHEAGI